ncbi:hypothetical protein ANO14919_081690 [Xylariales sp. No.14919]|nr:hypothetical protein ANO14919_081690 [Xylariales sp. No.14919]
MPTATFNGASAALGDDKMMPVAVVGMACRFPGDATSPTAFFEMLVKGRSAWSEVPKDRYNIDAYWHPSKERIGTTTARGGYWMKEDPALFDASVGAGALAFQVHLTKPSIVLFDDRR